MKPNYKRTIHACFVGYVVQGIVNNFAPLMFLTFQRAYHIPLTQITLLVTVNFTVQLLIDLLSAGFVDKIGYRASIILADVMAMIGLLLMVILPDLLPNPYAGLVVAVMFCAVGGGLTEVLVSPIVESCPSEHKEKAMSLLHSFYCWGQVGLVIISTLYFNLVGIQHWKVLCGLLSLVPLVDAIMFAKAPFAPLLMEGEKSIPVKSLFRNRAFWLMLLMMLCAGASELSVSQWASAFAEKGLGVSKTIGDLAGPMMFALLMGCSRFIYGRFGHRINLNNYMLFSGFLCVGAYLLTALAPTPIWGLIGCAICGFSVGVLWPGAISLSARQLRGGGTALFAFLALAGDIGCAAGPTLVGMVSGVFSDNLKIGMLSAIIFPVVLVIVLLTSKPNVQAEHKDVPHSQR